MRRAPRFKEGDICSNWKVLRLLGHKVLGPNEKQYVYQCLCMTCGNESEKPQGKLCSAISEKSKRCKYCRTETEVKEEVKPANLPAGWGWL